MAACSSSSKRRPSSRVCRARRCPGSRCMSTRLLSSFAPCAAPSCSLAKTSSASACPEQTAMALGPSTRSSTAAASTVSSWSSRSLAESLSRPSGPSAPSRLSCSSSPRALKTSRSRALAESRPASSTSSTAAAIICARAACCRAACGVPTVTRTLSCAPASRPGPSSGSSPWKPADKKRSLGSLAEPTGPAPSSGCTAKSSTSPATQGPSRAWWCHTGDGPPTGGVAASRPGLPRMAHAQHTPSSSLAPNPLASSIKMPRKAA
mmetsp:Transcript_107173/g.303075  ORF Transcript_107173/g.303075 Transcript_107173/m.303075 type:complete len:264 (+) Transcript_107173:1840-2631(+)